MAGKVHFSPVRARSSPLYEHEVQKALDLIAKLEKCLS